MKKILVLIGVIILLLSIPGIYLLVSAILEDGGSGVITVDGILLLLDIIVSVGVGLILIKNNDSLLNQLKAPAKDIFNKPLPGWLIVYGIIVLVLLAASYILEMVGVI